MLARVLLTLASGVLFAPDARSAGLPADRTLFRERIAVTCEGRSMLPTLPAACRLVIVRVPFEEVRAGLLDGDVISTRWHGKNVAHRAVERRPDGALVTWGDNNPSPDRIFTTRENYVGVIVAVERRDAPGELAVPGVRAPRATATPLPTSVRPDSPGLAETATVTIPRE